MSENGMVTDWQPHPWVSEGDGRVRMGIAVRSRAAPPAWSTVRRLVQALD